MTISYPLSMPSGIGYVRCELRAVLAQSRTRSATSLKEQLYTHSGEMWAVDITYPELTPTQMKDVAGFLLSLNGGVGTFLLGDPLMASPIGTATGTPLVMGASQTGKTLITDGWTNSVTNILKRGDYFQLENRLYMVLQNANSNGSGQATFDIFPRLRSSPADNAALTVSSPKGLFRLDGSDVSWSGSREGVYSVGFSAVEAI